MIASLVWLATTPALAGPCDEMLRLSNQTAAMYRTSRDGAHAAASQNYRSGYNACLRQLRDHGYTPAGRPIPGMVLPPAGLIRTTPTTAYADAAARSRQVEAGADMSDPAPARPNGRAALYLTYDSVTKQDCPDGLSRRCISDTWRSALALVEGRGVRIPVRYTKPDYSPNIISEEQYLRMARGEADFEDIQTENILALADRILEDIERQARAIR